MKKKVLKVFEHQSLRIGQNGFTQKHLDALLKLNDYHQNIYFQPISKGIKFNQYVGILQIAGLVIEIHPKADKDDEDFKWQDVLIKMLKATGKLKPDTSGLAEVRRQNMNLLEVYFELYLNEISKLIRLGLVKKYRKEANNVKALKGKLEFTGNIRYNTIRKERFYTIHQVYDHNHLLHQLLFEALSIVEHFTKGERLNDFAKRVSMSFPYVARQKISSKHFTKIKLNRKTKPYTYAIELARLILLNYSPDIATGKEKMLSLLFDMNQLWEEYILRQLQNHTKNKDIKIIGQDSKSFWGSNFLRPDIVIEHKNQIYIIDTKWKRPQNSTASMDDLRQMYAYCRRWQATKVILLYPGKPQGKGFKRFHTSDYSNFGDETESIIHQCKMGFVSVIDEEGNLDLNLGNQILILLNL